MITFKFNEIKTTQVAAIFIKLNNGQLNYTKLIKLLYLADRTALSLWDRPLSGDSYFSLPNGPILSKTYDLINYKEDPQKKSHWYRYISKKNYDVVLKNDPGHEELSKREIALIHRIFTKYKDKDWRQMIDICHRILPEWKDPGRTSNPIKVEKIFKAVNKTEKEIKIITEEISTLEYVRAVLSA
jgi:uncharacterized phage-associated protein